MNSISDVIKAAKNLASKSLSASLIEGQVGIAGDAGYNNHMQQLLENIVHTIQKRAQERNIQSKEDLPELIAQYLFSHEIKLRRPERLNQTIERATLDKDMMEMEIVISHLTDALKIKAETNEIYRMLSQTVKNSPKPRAGHV